MLNIPKTNVCTISDKLMTLSESKTRHKITHHTKPHFHVNLAQKGWKVAIWSCPGSRYVLEDDKVFLELPNVFGIADDILILGCDDDGTDHDATVCRVVQVLKKRKSKAQQRQMSLGMHQCPILWEIISRYWSTNGPRKFVHTYRNASAKVKEGTTLIPRHNTYLGRYTLAIPVIYKPLCKSDRHKIGMGMEQGVPGTIQKSKGTDKENECMKLCVVKKKLLYFGTDT